MVGFNAFLYMEQKIELVFKLFKSRVSQDRFEKKNFFVDLFG